MADPRLTLVSEFLELTLVYEGLELPLAEVGLQGIPGQSQSYEYIQASASETWIVNHNLGFRPSVQAFDDRDRQIFPEIWHYSINQTRLIFNWPQTGFVRFV